MTSPFNPLPIARGNRASLGGTNLIGAEWAVDMGIDQRPADDATPPCIIDGAPNATCRSHNHSEGRTMPPAARRQAKKAGRRTPGTARRQSAPAPNTGTTGDVGTMTAPPAVAGTNHEDVPVVNENTTEIAGAPVTSETENAPDAIVAQEGGGSFTATMPAGSLGGSASPDATPVHSEVANQDGESGAPAANADDPGTDNTADEPRRARAEGEPNGFIVEAGQLAKKLPVRRIEGNDNLVETRDDIYVRRLAAGSTKTYTYTLLLAKGARFPKHQLDQRII